MLQHFGVWWRAEGRGWEDGGKVEREGDEGGSPFEPKVTSEGELDAPGEFDAPHKKMERSSRSNIRRSK
jgi:hypothetical protein